MFNRSASQIALLCLLVVGCGKDQGSNVPPAPEVQPTEVNRQVPQGDVIRNGDDGYHSLPPSLVDELLNRGLVPQSLPFKQQRILEHFGLPELLA